MSVIKKNKEFQCSDLALAEWRRKTEADAIERERVLIELETTLDKYSDDQVIIWFDYQIELREGSSLYEVYNPGRLLFNSLLTTSPVHSAISQERGNAELICAKPGPKLETLSDSGWIDLVAAGHFHSSESTLAELELLSEFAKVAGGYIWPDCEITLDQWFAFHEISIPKTKAQVKNLIGFLKFDPQATEFGNYWEYIEADDQMFVSLNQE